MSNTVAISNMNMFRALLSELPSRDEAAAEAARAGASADEATGVAGPSGKSPHGFQPGKPPSAGNR